MTNLDFLDDVERRITDNGSHPVKFNGLDILRLKQLAGLVPINICSHYDGILGHAGLRMVRMARKRIAQAVAEKLNPPETLDQARARWVKALKKMATK